MTGYVWPRKRSWRKRARSDLPEGSATRAESETRGRPEIAISVEMKIFSENKNRPQCPVLHCPSPPLAPTQTALRQPLGIQTCEQADRTGGGGGGGGVAVNHPHLLLGLRRRETNQALRLAAGRCVCVCVAGRCVCVCVCVCVCLLPWGPRGVERMSWRALIT